MVLILFYFFCFCLFVFKIPFYFVCLLHVCVTLVPARSCISFEISLCLFIFGKKKTKKEEKKRIIIMPHSQGYPSPSLSCCPLLLNLILQSLRKRKTKQNTEIAEKKTKHENVNEKYLLFLLVPFCVCRLLSPSACVRVALSFFVIQLRACLFYFLFCWPDPTLPLLTFQPVSLIFLCLESCICLYTHLYPLPPSPVIMFCVLFSVLKLFVPFSVSFLSLLGPCVEGGRCCPPCVVSFRYYIEFNDNDII